ncbi:MAG: manganese catalase family protein [Ginsengibacter sp.]
MNRSLKRFLTYKRYNIFYHIKDLQYNARVSKPDPAFATLLLEQFGGANGEYDSF